VKLKGTELVKLLCSVVFTGLSEGGRGEGWEEDRKQEGKRR